MKSLKNGKKIRSNEFYQSTNLRLNLLRGRIGYLLAGKRNSVARWFYEIRRRGGEGLVGTRPVYRGTRD